MKKKGTRYLHQDTKPLISHNPIPTSLFLPKFKTTTYIFMRQDVVVFALPIYITNKQVKANKDVGMGL